MERGGYYSVDSLSGVYALVVADVRDTQAMLRAVLEYCGALVATADTAEAALASMKQVKPDVLVVSLALPHDDALRLLRAVRALKPEEGGTVPVVALSEGALEPRGPRFSVYLSQPFDPWELCRTISTLVLVG